MGDRLDDVIGRLPARLRELRAEAGLSQKALSERSGVPQPTISAYEQGGITPTWPAVVRLADALGVTPAAFLARPRVDTVNQDDDGLTEALPDADRPNARGKK